MGGEGSMMAANNSLIANRSLLAKRKENKALSGSYEGVEIATFPKATEKELAVLREKLKQERRQMRMRQAYVFIGVIVLFVIFVVLLF